MLSGAVLDQASQLTYAVPLVVLAIVLEQAGVLALRYAPRVLLGKRIVLHGSEVPFSRIVGRIVLRTYGRTQVLTDLNGEAAR